MNSTGSHKITLLCALLYIVKEAHVEIGRGVTSVVGWFGWLVGGHEGGLWPNGAS